MARSEAEKVIARVRSYGGDLRPSGADQLTYRGPELDDELRALIRQHKAEIILTLDSPKFLQSACLLPGCARLGWTVELGVGLATTLCAPHRRDLFASARERSAGQNADVGIRSFASCRFCGVEVPPEEEPCVSCSASRFSPCAAGS